MLIIDTQTQDITIDSGCQEKVRFYLTNSDGTLYNGVGALVRFVVKESRDDLLTAAKVNVDSTTNPTQFDVTQLNLGIVDVEFLPSNTSALGGKTYHYGLGVVDTGGKPHEPRSAFFTVRRRVAA